MFVPVLNKNALALVILLTSALSGVLALCPGNTPCNGHGTCGPWDLCTCNKGWKGYDCSLRVCPYAKAFSDIKNSLISGRDEHHYEECSAKGDCNRATGICDCFEGFEGAACQRMSCPESCNGHGTCELMSEVNSGYAGWDADKIQVCKCDPGWTGQACDKRMCHPGDDPLTLHSVNGVLFQEDEVQSIDFQASSGITGYFTLSYEDWRGVLWTTHPINIETAKAISIEEALEALPNQAIPSVTVSIDGTDNDPTGGALKFYITFSSDATSGTQPLLKINSDGCDIHGCQPAYAPLAGTALTATVSRDTTGTEENAECSKRGTCNDGNGLCECFDGYYGESCQFQTILT